MDALVHHSGMRSVMARELAVLADVGHRTSSRLPRASVRMVVVVDACWNTEEGSFFMQRYPVLDVGAIEDGG